MILNSAKMLRGKTRIRQHEGGATAIEYALIASLIAVVIVVGAQRLGENISGKFNEIASTVDEAGDP